MEVFRPQNVPESRLRQQPRRVMRVLHVGDGHRGIGDTVVNNGVYRHCHRVLREHLKSHRTGALVKSYNSVEVETGDAQIYPNERTNLVNTKCLQFLFYSPIKLGVTTRAVYKAIPRFE